MHAILIFILISKGNWSKINKIRLKKDICDILYRERTVGEIEAGDGDPI